MCAYRLSIHDNGSRAFAGRTDVKRCGNCGELLSKWDESLTEFVMPSRARLDLSCTYDGVDIASVSFKELYDGSGLVGLSFAVLPNENKYFKITADFVVAFDSRRRRTQFISGCPACGRYESVIGATPVFLKDGEVVRENGFARTDLEFGSGDEKSPMLVCGPRAAEVLMASKLKGLDVVLI